MAQFTRFKLRLGGAAAVMALAWGMGSGVADAATHHAWTVGPCYDPGSTAAGGAHVTAYYGNGSPASAYQAYAQLPSSTPAAVPGVTSGTLAFTGSQPILLGVGGVALIALGGALVGLSRGRPLAEGLNHEAP